MMCIVHVYGDEPKQRDEATMGKCDLYVYIESEAKQPRERGETDGGDNGSDRIERKYCNHIGTQLMRRTTRKTLCGIESDGVSV